MKRSTILAASLLALAFAVASAAGAEDPVKDAKDLKDLVEKFHSTEGRRDDIGYESQRKALAAIADLGTEDARKALKTILADVKTGERRSLLLVLGAIVRRGGKDEVDLAIETVEQARDPSLVDALATVLGGAQRDEAREYLRGGALANTPPAIKAQVARALGAIGDKAAVGPLMQTCKDPDLRVRAECLLALGELKDETSLPLMVAFLKSVDPRLGEVAARALGTLGVKRAVGPLIRALAFPAPLLVESVADSLGRLEDGAAIGPLIDRLAAGQGKDLRVTDAISRALERLSGKSLGDDPELWKAWWAEAQKSGPPAAPPEAPTTVSGPRYYGFPVRSSHFVFVIDVSRSMSWNERLETAQKELKQVIEHLPKGATFDLISFSDVAVAWRGKLVPSTHENVELANRHVDHLKALSGTNIHDALRLALGEEGVDTVFFLSDGSPSVGEIVDPDQLLSAVREWNRWSRIRIHTIALLKGEPPPTFSPEENRDRAAAFLKSLAEDNGGKFREIR